MLTSGADIVNGDYYSVSEKCVDDDDDVIIVENGDIDVGGDVEKVASEAIDDSVHNVEMTTEDLQNGKLVQVYFLL